MHIVVNSQFFAQELRLLNKVAPAKAPLPILKHILIETQDEKIKMSATDLEIGLVTTCPARITVPGSLALPAETLLAMVNNFEDGEVMLSAEEKFTHIRCGAFTSRIQSLPASDFPKLPELKGTAADLPTREFSQLIARTRYAVAEEAAQLLIRGALLTLEGEVGAMVGLDGRRLSLATIARTGPNLRTTIPSKTLDVLVAQPDLSHPTTTITVGERHLFFTLGSRLLLSRMIDAEFPKFERIIPQNSNKKAIVSRPMLASALRRVGLVAGDTGAARFAFSADRMEITSSSAEVGEAGEEVPIQYSGDPITICCNWRFVVDFLQAATSANVSLEMTDLRTPLLLTEGENHLAVVMLMQG